MRIQILDGFFVGHGKVQGELCPNIISRSCLELGVVGVAPGGLPAVY